MRARMSVEASDFDFDRRERNSSRELPELDPTMSQISVGSVGNFCLLLVKESRGFSLMQNLVLHD